jgi:hypothetical protein
MRPQFIWSAAHDLLEALIMRFGRLSGYAGFHNKSHNSSSSLAAFTIPPVRLLRC